MSDWIDTLGALADEGEPTVLVTVAVVRGSAPREAGAKMLVTALESIGSIGGGQLEYQCIGIACDMLKDEHARRGTLRKFVLGAGCGQCCGGVVEVLFEPVSATAWLQELRKRDASGSPFVSGTSLNNEHRKYLLSARNTEQDISDYAWPPASAAVARTLLAGTAGAVVSSGILLEPVRPGAFHIAVFGAGHVGAATVDALCRLDCRIHWIDSRRNLLPRRLPKNVLATETVDPASEVASMPEGTYYLVMTHSHPLDLQICDRILSRGDYGYAGLIGSSAKRCKFERQLKRQGHTAVSLSSLHCPIGLPGLNGKKPVEIALSVAADLLQRRQAMAEKMAAVPNVLRVPG